MNNFLDKGQEDKADTKPSSRINQTLIKPLLDQNHGQRRHSNVVFDLLKMVKDQSIKHSVRKGFTAVHK